MSVLNESELSFFGENGYLVVENAVTTEELSNLRTTFAEWVEESRNHNENYGETIDGRPRFDLEDSHSTASPKLRRVNSPVEISKDFYNVMANSRMTDCVADLIGPNVKFHHSKINSKLPGGATAVKWHQDFPFTPHSNDDLITALLMLDDVSEVNGPLEVQPGTHKGPIHSLWHDGSFTGAIDEAVEDDCRAASKLCTGSAGSVCLMHTRLLHGSAVNLSQAPRTLFICVYSADDAVPLSPNPVPSRFEGQIVRGKRSGRVRSIDYEVELPQKPSSASFFAQQAGQDSMQ